ncbi:VPLPA-CTERM protein sorting domain-containing protein [Rhodovulum sp. ES.010]|uniref:hypothetical protein n=1 Tax=Rhodovulum sp. ES.010 TaxID=1882821 RepID=UPI00092AA702|nr:hypothetical protein [Rhodovulum sp. ES.010]SIO24520.1 VPLPA-CTERM protein sorting domain-containing protein [Rhodovulum sp. ES.010]
MTIRLCAAASVATFAFGGVAYADSISPASYSDTLSVGESVTIEKTVVVEESASSALLDVHFLFDTSGSMGGAIGAAKTDAGAILTGLSGFGGDLAVGVGAFSEGANLTNAAPGNVVNQDLTTSAATAQSAINAITLGNPDGGGDFPERGQDAVKLAADNVSWRPGSNRFIVALGDASWKNDLTTDAQAIAALDAANVSLIGLRFSNFSASDPDSDDTTFTQSVEDLGGTSFATGTGTGDVVDSIIAGITASFAEYEKVTVDDLGNGLPFIDVSVVCTSADVGSCVGDTAEGSYDRSVARSFTFDVTFTRLAAGEASFDTYGLVDGGIVATEADRFTDGTDGVIPLPASGLLLLSGVGALAFRRRNRG